MDASTRPPRTGFGAYLLQATIVNWISSFLTVLYALFITPLVIKALRQDLYGVWSFLNGLLAYSSFFYVGLGSAFIKYLSRYRALDDRRGVNRLASVVFVIYTIIGGGCLFLCVALAPHIPGLFARPLEDTAARQTVTAFALLGSRLLFMFVATVFSGVLIAEERIVAASRITIVATLARFAVVPPLLGYGRPLVTLATIMSVSAAAEALALAFSAARIVPQFRLSPVWPRWNELRMLYGFGIRSFFVDLAGWLVNYTDVIVIGVVVGAAGVAVYSIPLQLVTYGRVIVQGMASALLPRLTTYETAGDRAGMGHAYVRISGVTNLVAALVALNLLTIGVPFLRLWVGRELADAGAAVLTILALAGYFQAVSTQSTVPFFQALHTLRAPVVVLTAEGLANLGLSLWLAHRIGVNGVAIATLLPAVVITTVALPASLCRTLRISVRQLLTSAIGPSLVLLAVGVAMNLVADEFLVVGSYTVLLLRGTMNLLLAGIVILVVVPKQDLRSLVSFITQRPARVGS